MSFNIDDISVNESIQNTIFISETLVSNNGITGPTGPTGPINPSGKTFEGGYITESIIPATGYTGVDLGSENSHFNSLYTDNIYTDKIQLNNLYITSDSITNTLYINNISNTIKSYKESYKDSSDDLQQIPTIVSGTANNTAVLLGPNAGGSKPVPASIAIGNNSAKTSQGFQAISVGNYAGFSTQNNFAVALGSGSGVKNQGESGIGIGSGSGQINQGMNSVSIGTYSGKDSQGIESIALGSWAGSTNQGNRAIAIGQNAGAGMDTTSLLAKKIKESHESFLLGKEEDKLFSEFLHLNIQNFRDTPISGQNDDTIAVGTKSGQFGQGASAIAIGTSSGQNNQPEHSVLIGTEAGIIGKSNINSTIIVGKGNYSYNDKSTIFYNVIDDNKEIWVEIQNTFKECNDVSYVKILNVFYFAGEGSEYSIATAILGDKGFVDFTGISQDIIGIGKCTFVDNNSLIAYIGGTKGTGENSSILAYSFITNDFTGIPHLNDTLNVCYTISQLNKSLNKGIYIFIGGEPVITGKSSIYFLYSKVIPPMDFDIYNFNNTLLTECFHIFTYNDLVLTGGFGTTNQDGINTSLCYSKAPLSLIDENIWTIIPVLNSNNKNIFTTIYGFTVSPNFDNDNIFIIVGTNEDGPGQQGIITYGKLNMSSSPITYNVESVISDIFDIVGKSVTYNTTNKRYEAVGISRVFEFAMPHTFATSVDGKNWIYSSININFTEGLGISEIPATVGNNIALGYRAGYNSQGQGAIALGKSAGSTNQGKNAIAIGVGAGVGITDNQNLETFKINIQGQQAAESIAIGYHAGGGVNKKCISIGSEAGLNQGDSCIAIGTKAGYSTQDEFSIAIGNFAGNENQNAHCIAIGDNAGQKNQTRESIAIGHGAGGNNQGTGSISIGSSAGSTDQGESSIAIGQYAGNNNQAANSIILNASGNTVDSIYSNSIVLCATGTGFSATGSGFFVNPIRSSSTSTPVCVYNSDTAEITYSTSSKRYKKNIRDKVINSEAIYKLRTVEFDSIQDSDNLKNIVGYIAEEVAEVDPIFAGYIKDENGDNIPDSIDWFKILLYSVEEIKKQKEQLDEQKILINDLLSRLERLESFEKL